MYENLSVTLVVENAFYRRLPDVNPFYDHLRCTVSEPLISLNPARGRVLNGWGKIKRAVTSFQILHSMLVNSNSYHIQASLATQAILNYTGHRDIQRHIRPSFLSSNPSGKEQEPSASPFFGIS